MNTIPAWKDLPLTERIRQTTNLVVIVSNCQEGLKALVHGATAVAEFQSLALDQLASILEWTRACIQAGPDWEVVSATMQRASDGQLPYPMPTDEERSWIALVQEFLVNRGGLHYLPDHELANRLPQTIHLLRTAATGPSTKVPFDRLNMTIVMLADLSHQLSDSITHLHLEAERIVRTGQTASP